ncbi:MAG TPA: LamG domain-containing protein [Phycisphaerales bacterium]|nr:LamG domain-containing protein [Phycisphaerales bacterium]HMP38111.1 LamG domain-containing protein [Phycisphaerales bacterium]
MHTFTHRNRWSILRTRDLLALPRCAAVAAAAALGLGGIAGPLRGDLVGHWPMDEAGGSIVHDVVGPNDGTIVGNAAFVPGKIGNALSFALATNDHVTLGNVFEFAGNTDFSVAFWMKPAATSTPEHLPVSKHTAGFNNGWIVFVNVSGGCYGAPNRTTFYTSNSCGGEIISTTAVTDGEWHFVVATVDGGAVKSLYIDGGLAEATGAANPIAATASQLLFGGVSVGGGTAGAYTGLLDDVQIYDSTLSCAQVAAMYAAPGSTAPLVYDLNHDGLVNGADLGILLGGWGPCSAVCPADFDCNGVVDGADLGALLASWT